MADLTGRLRREVAARAQGLCEYCRCPELLNTGTFSVDHVIPRSKGGGDDLENLAFCCQGCNNTKYNKVDGKDPVTEGLVALYHPRRQRWRDHFKWSDDFLKLEGLTAAGRATISLLQLNREKLVAIRALLKQVGKHPPREGG
jgi:HNH endonuclease